MDRHRSRSQSHSSTSSRPTATTTSPTTTRSFASISLRPETHELEHTTHPNHPGRSTPRTGSISGPPLITSFHRYEPTFVASEPEQASEATSSHISPTDLPMDRRRGKRRRGSSSQEGGDEKEAGPSGAVGPTTIFVNPPKKRTRTLTTPHQASVLHALLAKSRFPTTAMREEIGRQIGLSARKVQVWFQNQRQKAKRPHAHGGAAGTVEPKPVQEARFPGTSTMEFASGASSISSPEIPYPSGTASSFRLEPFHSGGESDTERRGYRASFDRPVAPGAPGTPFQLAGPGVPGARPRVRAQELPLYQAESPWPHGASRLPQDVSSSHFPRSAHEGGHGVYADAEGNRSASLQDPGYSPTYLTHSSHSSMSHEAHESLTLPPLNLDATGQLPLPALSSEFPRGDAYLAGSASSAFPTTYSTAPMLPPPITLEPRPLWSAPRLPLTGFGSFSPTTSSRRSSHSSYEYSRPSALTTSPVVTRSGAVTPTSVSPQSPYRPFGGGVPRAGSLTPLPPHSPSSPRRSPEMPSRLYTTDYDPVRFVRDSDEDNQT